MGKILITGGCGYIGSHTIIDLINHGFDVISIDNFINSSPDTMDKIESITGTKPHNYPVDLVDLEALEKVFQENEIDAIIHFAALKAVGESVDKPLIYYRNNISGIINLLECALRYKVAHFIFSSSCTVYGQANILPVTEDTEQQRAESPYGYSKQVSERIIEDAIQSRKMNAVLLRYFNPAGAHESNLIGESPINPAQNLVPIITEVAIGKRKSLTVFGQDYDTRDGTCLRDYIHVMDLASAHTKALQWMQTKQLDEGCSEIFNLGSGNGTTVLEAIDAFLKVSGQALPHTLGPRRPGDIAAIYSDHEKAKKVLHWEPLRNIEDIMQTAWAWEKSRSEGKE